MRFFQTGSVDAFRSMQLEIVKESGKLDCCHCVCGMFMTSRDAALGKLTVSSPLLSCIICVRSVGRGTVCASKRNITQGGSCWALLQHYPYADPHPLNPQLASNTYFLGSLSGSLFWAFEVGIHCEYIMSVWDKSEIITCVHWGPIKRYALQVL